MQVGDQIKPEGRNLIELSTENLKTLPHKNSGSGKIQVLHGGYTFSLSLMLEKYLPFWDRMANISACLKKIIKRKARETGDIVDKVSEREREREEAQKLSHCTCEDSYIYYRI